MEVDMELTKKTTVLFSEDLYNKLKKLAHTKKRSIGDLIRSACEKQYHLYSSEEAREAVEVLAKLSLPVDSVAEMKKQLSLGADDLLK